MEETLKNIEFVLWILFVLISGMGLIIIFTLEQIQNILKGNQ